MGEFLFSPSVDGREKDERLLDVEVVSLINRMRTLVSKQKWSGRLTQISWFLKEGKSGNRG